MHTVAIIGVTGYSGRELERLLGGHPSIRVAGRFASKDDSATGAGRFTLEGLRSTRPDIVVLATDHAVSFRLVPELWKEGYRILDMSGAFRLKDATLYPAWYGEEHPAPDLLTEAVYGLPEVNAASIAKARLVANPGCYATAAILPLRPLLEAGVVDTAAPVVVDGKSGVSGAGRTPSPRTHFCEVTNNIQAYGVLRHRHTPEMIANLPGCTASGFVFTPHLIPVDRGILNTMVFRQTGAASVRTVLADRYGRSPFVRLMPASSFPDIQGVLRTNRCDIGVGEDGDRVVVVSTIDNLIKGAAGQSVENLNLMFGLPREDGLA